MWASIGRTGAAIEIALASGTGLKRECGWVFGFGVGVRVGVGVGPVWVPGCTMRVCVGVCHFFLCIIITVCVCATV